MPVKKILVFATLAAVIIAAGWWIARRSARTTGDASALAALLPADADLYAVADVQDLLSNPAVRALLSNQAESMHAEDYKEFLNATGFRYQEDLEQIALAKVGADWVGAARLRLDRQRAVAYLESKAASKSSEEGHQVYAYGSARPFRLVFLEEDLVAFSIGAQGDHLKSMLARRSERSKLSAAAALSKSAELGDLLPRAGELRIWGRLDRWLDKNPEGPSLGPFQLGKEMLQGSRTLTVSVESSAFSLEVHAEDQCESAAAAARIANVTQTLRTLLRPAASTPKAAEGANMGPILDALEIRHADSSVLFDWRWNPSML